MPDTAFSSPLIALMAGIGAAAMAWLCGRWAAQGVARWLGRSRAHEAPPGNDVPPFWFRVFAGPIGVLAGLADRRMSWRSRRALTRRLQVAGLHRAIDAAQFVGAQLFAALIGATVLGLFSAGQWGGPVGVLVGLAGACLGALLPRLWLRDRIVARRRAVVRALPFALDMITLCVEAGLNLQGALQQAVARGPVGPLRDELRQVLGDMRAGMARAQALRALADRIDEPAVRSLVAALVQAESMGMNLGALLRSQSDQRRSDRFLRAETLAMQAPVKMLLPLVVFIFPCTFLVIAFPIAVKLIGLAR
ncbi:type II secretion system F family protein [Pigmentiphaga aceris]|uniref:Type II secretion system F family protein n=1 Tax=Pigmentiphaga aceris TaxID=1940612 RepID=A0A5C0AZG4_9BURK|nr:type II secretion system F family protein [Pigmentiphaga aceris]QEI07575.1 type II secretion system F family protein [Pigmentiphaga aceris]